MMQELKFHSNVIIRAPLKSVSEFNYIDFTDDKAFSEALFVASTNFYNQQNKRLNSQKEKKKVEQTLHKYKLRICNRPTPFGLFAGIGVTNWSEKSDITITKKINRKSRLDMTVLCLLTVHLSGLPYIRKHLRYFPNNSLYSINEEIRYVEHILVNNNRQYRISSVKQDDFINSILKNAKKGLTIDELANLILNQNIFLDTAIEFVHELIDSQLLVSELDPNIVGEEYITCIIEVLTRINQKEPNDFIARDLSLLNDIITDFNEIDKRVGNQISKYNDIIIKLNALGLTIKPNNLFQVDYSISNLGGGISYRIQNDLKKTIQTLRLLTGSEDVLSNLNNFREKFREKYELEAVSLMHVLDSEIGIGYPIKSSIGLNPLLSDVKFNHNTSIKSNYNFTETEMFLLKKLIEIGPATQILNLKSDEIIASFGKNTNIFPDSLSISFCVLDAKENLLHFRSARSNATALIGRFGHLSEEINSILKDISDHEKSEKEDVIIAEIVHLSQDRTGNITSRPAFRDYEIHYLTNNSRSIAHQISPDDLLVQIIDKEIFLWSKSLKKRIIPRLGNSHNYHSNSLPFYQFLCDLQHEQLNPSITFNWGGLYGHFKYMPRVTIDNVIVSPATWFINKVDVPSGIFNLKTDLQTKLNLLITSFKLPNEVLISDYDNELLCDLGNKVSASILLETLVRDTKIILKENLKKNEFEYLCKDTDGHFYNSECIAFALVKNNKRPNLKTNLLCDYSTQRINHLGSDWIYVKIYCGHVVADIILNEIIYPLVNSLLNQQLINKWFFIRFADPDHHLRIRFQISNSSTFPQTMSFVLNFFSKFKGDPSVRRICFDTYQREIERYSILGVEFAEIIYFNDSIATLKFMSLNLGREKETYQWYWAILSIDYLLSDFGLNINEKETFFNIVNISMDSEFKSASKETKIVMDLKFRKLRLELIELITKKNMTDNLVNCMHQILQVRSNDNIQQIKSNKNETDKFRFYKQLMSYTHMHLNRTFSSESRKNEFVVYSLFQRYYSSLNAIDRKRTNSRSKSS